MGLDMYLEKEDGEELDYFRKFNALHGYIVDAYADGADECQPIHLNEAAVTDIYDRLSKVLADSSLGPELLPVCRGPFFGSYEYDYDYIAKVAYAKNSFKKLLDEFDFESGDVIYLATW